MTDEDINTSLDSQNIGVVKNEMSFVLYFRFHRQLCRPSVKQDDSQRMDDDLTHKLCDIIKSNNMLKQKIESNSRAEVINDWTKVLQYHTATTC